MYAIQSGNKFINVRYFCDPNEIFEFVVSAKPTTYRSRAEVDRDLNNMVGHLDHKIQHTKGAIADAKKAKTRYLREAERARALIQELEVRPYKEVHTQIESAKKRLDRAESEAKYSIWADWERDLARYERIKQAGLRVVKLQQTVVSVDKATA